MAVGEVVPIRLDIAVGQQQFQDTFCWSTAETHEAAESFAAALCRDNHLPQSAVPTVASAVTQQVNAVQECSLATSDEPQAERNEIIRLDINLGSQRLHDQFVWDVNNTERDPETFAQVLCKDLSADTAFVPLVAWHIRHQVNEHRRTERSSTSRSALDPLTTEMPVAAPRRTRRKASMKQPADAGFKSTYSSGVVRRPEEWCQWAAHVGSADAPLLPASPQAASTAHSQGGISAAPSQKGPNAAICQSQGSPQFPGQSTTALSEVSQHHPSGQTEQAWNQPYSQQQAQQAVWMQQQRQHQQQQQEQRQQYTAAYIRQAQAIWERMHLAAMGITLPQSLDEAETVVKAVQSVPHPQQQVSNATNASVQSRFGPKTGPSQFQDVGVRANSAAYAPGFKYTAASQATQGQMNPLLMDYAGLQYPGY